MTNLGNRLVERIDRFWFAQARLEPLVICRISFGLSLFFHYLTIFGSRQLIFGPDGLIGHRFLEHLPQAGVMARSSSQSLQILRYISEPALIDALMVTLLVASLAFAIGLFTRTSGVLALTLHIVFHSQDEFAYWGWGDLIIPFMAYIVFAGVGECFSVDSRGSRLSQLKLWEGPAWPLRLTQIHVSTVYLVAAWARLHDPNWLDGTMLYGVLVDLRFGRVDSQWRMWMPVLRGLCYASWGCELLAPVLLWVRPSRRAMVVVLILMHIGLEILTKVGYWNFIMIAALMSFWSKSSDHE